MRQPVPILFIRIHEIVSIGNVLRAYAVRPLSRRTKPIVDLQKRLPAAGNRSKLSENAFPRREMGKNLRKTVFCGGKAIKSLEKRLRAAGRR